MISKRVSKSHSLTVSRGVRMRLMEGITMEHKPTKTKKTGKTLVITDMTLFTNEPEELIDKLTKMFNKDLGYGRWFFNWKVEDTEINIKQPRRD